jgi:hypothetical protein
VRHPLSAHEYLLCDSAAVDVREGKVAILSVLDPVREMLCESRYGLFVLDLTCIGNTTKFVRVKCAE